LQVCTTTLGWLFLFFFFLFAVMGLNSGPSPWATPPVLFLRKVFRDSVSWSIYLSWFWTVILLISASWVAKIIGVSHQRLATHLVFFQASGADWDQIWSDCALHLLSCLASLIFLVFSFVEKSKVELNSFLDWQDRVKLRHILSNFLASLPSFTRLTLRCWLSQW
jgi:hypothetical protein